ncbi:MAG: beta-ketoacyl synthase chain length factor [Gammaproteobacteria bacterium]
MHQIGLRFSIAAQAAWAPGLTTHADWQAWAQSPHRIVAGAEPPVAAMAPMLRRRTGMPGKMALEVAYACVGARTDIPTVFCSRHGEVARAVDLLADLARAEALSPTAFGLAVHNATAGLFSIARHDHANHSALAGGDATVEHGVIEACGLLADGHAEVLLVAYDRALPEPLEHFADCDEQPHAWAWLVTAPEGASLGLAWDAADEVAPDAARPPGMLDVLRFALSDADCMERVAGSRRWTWTRHA